SGVSLTRPYIRVGNLEVRVPKIWGYYSFNQPSTINYQQIKNCDQFNQGILKHDLVTENGRQLLRLTSIDSSNCLDFDLSHLAQRLGYLVTVENRNIDGKSLLFSVINKNSQRADIETYLPKYSPGRSNFVTPSRWPNGLLEGGIGTSYFIIPPMEQYGLGYTLHLDNISIGRVKTVNDLGNISVNPIPYRFLTSMKIIKGDPLRTQGVPLQSVAYQVEHPNPSLYQVSISNEAMKQFNNLTMVLSQSFDDGWKAYAINNQQLTIINYLFPFLFGKELKDHVLVNNWENGWRLNNETMKQCNNEQCNIIIVYLPQYLEYIGFGFLLFVPLLLVKTPRTILG
ncbi:hypothetical protein HY945_01270, partial [Candidatus Gottesmanbacteria bacterium]|nr:hypothetical protein [Candidatus Gottesmanbacteria bacterium]